MPLPLFTTLDTNTRLSLSYPALSGAQQRFATEPTQRIHKKTLNWRNWYLTVYAAVREGTHWLLSGTLAGRRTESTLNGINIQLKGHTGKSKQHAGCIKLNKTKQQIVETREKKTRRERSLSKSRITP